MRVVTDEGETLGVMDTRDAIQEARNRGLDLVEIAPNAQPPVAKIIDYGKFLYEQKKKADKVRAAIAFRGREMTHRELGAKILKKLTEDLTDLAEVEVYPKMEGYQMFTIFVPKKAKVAEKKAGDGAAEKKAEKAEKTEVEKKPAAKKTPAKAKAGAVELKSDDEIF